MNDNFLYKYRPPVDIVFSENLRQRLLMLDQSGEGSRNRAVLGKPSSLHEKAWKFALSSLMVLAVLFSVFAFSEPVRAEALKLFRIVAGFIVEERNESPLKAFDQSTASPTATAAVDSLVGLEETSISPSQIAPTEYAIPTVSVKELIENPPFQFGFPTWVPQGFTLDEDAGIANSSSWISFVWTSPNRTEIEMLIEQDHAGYSIPAGEGSSEEIEVNGEPALLIRGFWNGNHEWDSRRGLLLIWDKDGHSYRLNYFERGSIHNEIVPIEGDMDTIVAELVRMAESIQGNPSGQ